MKWFVRQNRVMHRCIWRFWIWNEPCLKNFQQGVMALAGKVADKYGDKHPYLYRRFYTLIIAGFDDSVTDPELIEQAIRMARRALEHSPCKETLLYLATAHAKSGDYKSL